MFAQAQLQAAVGQPSSVPPYVPYQMGQMLQDARASAAEHRAADASQQEMRLRHQMLQQHFSAGSRQPAHQQQQPAHQQQQPAHQQPKPRVTNIIPHKSAPSQYSKTQNNNPYHQYPQQQQTATAVSSLNTLPPHAHGDMARPMPITASSAPTKHSQSQQQHHSMDYTLNSQLHAQQHQQQPASKQPRLSSATQSQAQSHEPPSYAASTGESINAAAGTRMATSSNRYMPVKSMPAAGMLHHPQQLTHQSPQQISPRDQAQSTGSMPTNPLASKSGSNVYNTDSRQPLDHRTHRTVATEQQQMQSQSIKPPARAASHVPYKVDSMRRNKLVEEQDMRTSPQSSSEIDMSTNSQRMPAAHSSMAPHALSSPNQVPRSNTKPAPARIPYKMDSMKAQQQQQSVSSASRGDFSAVTSRLQGSSLESSITQSSGTNQSMGLHCINL